MSEQAADEYYMVPVVEQRMNEQAAESTTWYPYVVEQHMGEQAAHA